MKANAIALLAIFANKLRLEVPLFQRQYVWSREAQWEPLWEDISRKFSEYLEGRKDAPVHFLGAMVLDQKQTPIGHVEKRQVIDGQQRLTTLQIFLAAFRDICREQGCGDFAKECENYTENRGMMADPQTERFKVWPTQLDRSQYRDVVSAGSRSKLESKHPLERKKYARKPEPRPQMVEAYLFFDDQLREFFLGTDDQKPIAADQPIAARLDECFRALKNALQVVAIDLEQGDDAQVIFETLNARGEPLLPADLLRNYIFLRAARANEPQEPLYEEYWQRFDNEFWRQQVRQGRLLRPRSDLFMQHFLASRQAIDVPVTHLFVEYKHWIERSRPFQNVREELATLAEQRDHFRRIIAPEPDDILCPLATFLECFDVRTAYPPLLHLLAAGLAEAQWREISDAVESYLLWRAVCGLTTKGYNRIFLAMTRYLQRDGASPQTIRTFLSGLTGDSSIWPRDAQFLEAWQTQPVYQLMNSARIVHTLRRLSGASLGKKSERIIIDSELTVEHLMPQNWCENWPVPDGSRGISADELWRTDPKDPGFDLSRRRNALIQTFGNLTILTQALNSSVSNAAWSTKRPELLNWSLLPINQALHGVSAWDESAIEARSATLFKEAIILWPPPEEAGVRIDI